MSVTRGVLRGPRADLQAACNFLEEKNMRLTALIDRVFPFEHASGAFEYFGSGSHVGKVVVRL